MRLKKMRGEISNFTSKVRWFKQGFASSWVIDNLPFLRLIIKSNLRKWKPAHLGVRARAVVAEETEQGVTRIIFNPKDLAAARETLRAADASAKKKDEEGEGAGLYKDAMDFGSDSEEQKQHKEDDKRAASGEAADPAAPAAAFAAPMVS
ncbi:unnamed protein product, partial [Amoebophrya sp. A25]|eukprot:GSA25T00011901001.1